MSHNLVTENYMRLNFTPLTGITPGTDDHEVLSASEIIARYAVTVSPSTGGFCPKQSELTAASLTTPTVVLNWYQYIPFYLRVSGNVTSDGGATVTERGIIWSESPDPVLGGIGVSSLPCGSGTGAFWGDITPIDPLLVCYIRMYATNSEGTSYSDTFFVLF